jgi:RNA polymerase sigma-70 factor (ECF subfamily)
MASAIIGRLEPSLHRDAPVRIRRDSNEQELIAEAKSGDAAAWSALFKRFERRILAIAGRMMRNHEDAEDVVQQAFQRAFMHLDTFNGDSRFSTWLTRIAINEGLMMMRRRRANIVPIDPSTADGADSDPIIDVEDARPTPEQRYAELELRTSLIDSVLRLRPSLRAVVLLRELRDFSTEETANVLGISVAAVKARLFHARAKLRKTVHRTAGFRNRKCESPDVVYLTAARQS